MASPSSAEATGQLWDETLMRLHHLSKATVQRNAELETRLAEVETELTVWKHAHGAALEAAEREKKSQQHQYAVLNKQVAGIELNNQDLLILGVFDGNDCVFSDTHIIQGYQGGCQAAQLLTKGIAQHLSNEGITSAGRLSFWVTVFLSKRTLMRSLTAGGKCTEDQLEAFLQGFSQASPRFLIADVGPSREAVGGKIKEYLQTYGNFAQTIKIFFGGGQDNTYLSTFTSRDNEKLLGKLVVLRRETDFSPEMRSLRLPSIHVPDLFMTDRVAWSSGRPTPPAFEGLPSITTNGGLMSPKSTASSSTATGSGSGSKVIDPSKPLHKQSPPPCNEHYLMSCQKGAACKYSHDYILSEEQLATLARNAKKAPCNFLKNGIPCPHGDQCCWGHYCPHGPSCFHLSKGKCWFKGDAMHSLPE
ncbi:hypothetical protein JAAARDRAFT_64556 [Jaapia argillacea MUCL 33604]|uniref:C3H1-type domain-containing protein n=1 Tax=Jaapia argillacea MUCL 33604 TaxID=933084 RepID=A0A067QQ02_9AGAM|nr:hypothetical protein JAAARDRAFT_64556 [Jaapia argillacea MUCL 33604]